MKRKVRPLISAIVLVLSGNGAAAMDFTPIEVRTVEDGCPMRRFAFHDGPKTIYFQPPKDWKIFGGGQEVSFAPPSPLQGEVRMGNSPIEPSITFDQAGLTAYRTVASQLPPKADNVEILSETTNAYPLDDWQSFEMWFSYHSNGSKRIRWVLFITMNPNRQVRVVVDGTEKDFSKVLSAGRGLLGSWFEPPEGWKVLAAVKAP